MRVFVSGMLAGGRLGNITDGGTISLATPRGQSQIQTTLDAVHTKGGGVVSRHGESSGWVSSRLAWILYGLPVKGEALARRSRDIVDLRTESVCKPSCGDVLHMGHCWLVEIDLMCGKKSRAGVQNGVL